MERQALVLVGLLALGFVAVGVLFLMPSGQGKPPADSSASPVPSGEFQIVNINAVSSGYDPQVVRVKAGQPVELRFSAEPGAGCSRVLVMKDFGVQLIARDGTAQIARFTPETPGRFVFRCGMNMYQGTLIVE
ncbi:TPA: hypothetical protein HA244_01390 [Candidatus Micrarchaeota archaeon]|nr:hypothetical protein [Candidatus Micrarchaeota archaeon]